MSQRIVYRNSSGGISIITPAPESGLTIDQVAQKDVPAGVSYWIVDEADIPGDRYFRNAWDVDGANRFLIDMTRAREIHRDRLRQIRKPKLEALDIEFQRAIEAGDVGKQQEITQKKEALRRVTEDPAIDAARTPDELKSVIPAILLNGIRTAVARFADVIRKK